MFIKRIILLKYLHDKIETCLKYVNMNKSCGPDGFRGKLLKSCHGQLACNYKHILNMSLNMQCISMLR